ncbi:MAG: hypothetical protein R3E66_05945 [bacterium]
MPPQEPGDLDVDRETSTWTGNRETSTWTGSLQAADAARPRRGPGDLDVDREPGDLDVDRETSTWTGRPRCGPGDLDVDRETSTWTGNRETSTWTGSLQAADAAIGDCRPKNRDCRPKNLSINVWLAACVVDEYGMPHDSANRRFGAPSCGWMR